MKENLKSIEELKDLIFLIDTYQRGYKWDLAQVYSLLTDINNFELEFERFYCLQPLVVKKLGDKKYELIDGQQRATTLHLILQAYQQPIYQLNYTTRGTEDEGTNGFVENINHWSLPDFTNMNDFEGFSKFENKITEHWKNSVVKDKPEDNTIDNFYFYKNYVFIAHWLNHLDDKQTNDFNGKLLKHTKVIWYEEVGNDAIKNFINFNEGKIELEQAELIKALFVLDIAKTLNIVQRQYEENQFADDWNSIEHQMSDEQFWQFLTNNKNDENLANKINLLFQLYNGFGKPEDRFYNYRMFERSFKDAKTQEEKKPDWNKIMQLYNSLEEWYFDRTSYHLIGAIIHLTNFTSGDILEKSKDAPSKTEFRNKLRQLLKEKLEEKNNNKEKKYDLEKIKYSDREKKDFQMLLLYNIALTEIDETEALFPFHRFYNTKMWNIEHILAKNDDGFTKLEEFENFHQDTTDLLEQLDNELSEENKSVLIEFLNVLKDLIEAKNFSECGKKVKEVNDKLEEFFSINDFNNLCLLDQSTNIKVGKKPFRRKRDIIFGFDEKIEIEPNTYIPIGTQYIFSKKTSPSENFQINYWSTKDREAYQSFVQNTIDKFLTPEQNASN